MLWFRKKKTACPHVTPPDPVVLEIKMRQDQAAKRASKTADKLNKIFEENGITLNIHIAAGGKNGH